MSGVRSRHRGPQVGGGPEGTSGVWGQALFCFGIWALATQCVHLVGSWRTRDLPTFRYLFNKKLKIIQYLTCRKHGHVSNKISILEARWGGSVTPGYPHWVPRTPDPVHARHTVLLLHLKVGCVDGRSYIHIPTHKHTDTDRRGSLGENTPACLTSSPLLSSESLSTPCPCSPANVSGFPIPTLPSK